MHAAVLVTDDLSESFWGAYSAYWRVSSEIFGGRLKTLVVEVILVTPLAFLGAATNSSTNNDGDDLQGQKSPCSYRRRGQRLH